MTDSESSYDSSDGQVESLLLSARSIGLSAEDRIKPNGKIGFIHSIFQRVINIAIPKNRLISIVGQEVGQGPLNILVRIPSQVDLTAIEIKRGDPVTRVGESIIIGRNLIVISTESAKLWAPRMNFRQNLQPIKTIMANIDILIQSTLASDRLNGLGELISFSQINGFKVSKTKKLGPLAVFAAPRIMSLIHAIKLGHSHDIIRTTKSIVGLGPGLTPACDDMLLGLMASIVYISENFTETIIDVKKTNTDILSSIPGRTTIFSDEFLQEASTGNVNEPIASLLKNLLTSEQTEVLNSAKNVLAIGGTSGADIVFGIILGSHLMFDNKLARDFRTE